MARAPKPRGSFKPLLADNNPKKLPSAEYLEAIVFPKIWSPKLDGIRTLIHPELGPVSRKLLPIPNTKLHAILSHPALSGLDGEMIYGPATDEKVFNHTQSCVMKFEGPSPYDADGVFYVFDDFTDPDLPYETRVATAAARVESLPDELKQVVKMTPYGVVHTMSALEVIEARLVDKGFEGVMLRSLSGVYKYGRSSLNEQILLKVKRFEDTECTIIGFEELMINENEKLRDELGHAKRSSAKENLVPGNKLGSLKLSHPVFGEFSMGSGFKDHEKVALWADRDALIGKTVCIKYQPSGMKDKPRFPVFKGFRND